MVKETKNHMGMDRSVSRDGNKVYLDEDNDGNTFLKRGAQTRSTEIVSADQKGFRLADGSLVTSSSGFLEGRAMAYFEEIAKESTNPS